MRLLLRIGGRVCNIYQTTVGSLENTPNYQLVTTNYRPISLFYTIGKKFEKLLLNRLNIYITPKMYLEQYGFRPHYSTTLQLATVL